jgi:hypothetical protein
MKLFGSNNRFSPLKTYKIDCSLDLLQKFDDIKLNFWGYQIQSNQKIKNKMFIEDETNEITNMNIIAILSLYSNHISVIF